MHPLDDGFPQKRVHKIIIRGPFESQTERNITVSNVVMQVKTESQVPEKPTDQGFSHIETKKPPRNEMVYIVSTSVDDCVWSVSH